MKKESLFENLKKEIDNGLYGKNGIIPFGYERVQDFIDISKNTMYTIAGETGAGKSTFVQEAFIIKPIEWYLKNRDKTDIKLSIIYFSMERKIYQYSAKWISRMIFLEHAKNISVKKILGRKGTLNNEEYKLVCKYEELFNQWEKDDLFIWYEGSRNPSGMSMFIEAFAKRNGTIHKKNKEDKSEENILAEDTYVPNHPNHIVLIITDHSGILKSEKGEKGEKKQRMDKYSETMRTARDLYGFSPVNVQQMNRNLSDVNRIKMGEAVKPKLSDLGDTSTTSQDSDVVIALYEPYRNATMETKKDILQLELIKMKDQYGYTYYRSLHILKSSFEASNLDFPMAFNPFIGMFKTISKNPKDWTDSYYADIVNKEFFKNKI